MKDEKDFINNIGKKCFVDSNILVYSIDTKESKKQSIASNLLENLRKESCAVISTQCLQEFYNVSTKKLGYPKDQVRDFVEQFDIAFPVAEISVDNILTAIEISIQTQFSFWDSLIVAMAEDSDCKVLYSEDLTDGQVVNGVEIVNPFG